MESLAKVTTSKIKNTVIDIRSKSARHGGRGVFDLYAEPKTLRERKKYKLRLIEDKHARTQRKYARTREKWKYGIIYSLPAASSAYRPKHLPPCLARLLLRNTKIKKFT